MQNRKYTKVSWLMGAFPADLPGFPVIDIWQNLPNYSYGIAEDLELRFNEPGSAPHFLCNILLPS